MAPFSKVMNPSSSGPNTPTNATLPPPSPFFQPSTPFQVKVIRTPGGSQHTQKVPKRLGGGGGGAGGGADAMEEHKSTILGCTANLINAIVGSGIVGIPFAIQQAGFCTGLVLVILCAFLTEKSLRILIETAKHVQVPTYETLCEAAFGQFGFLFISLNMFFLAYGAMTSYLMIVKDTFGPILGLTLVQQQRALLFCISLAVIVPLSSLRDMADLAQTSRFNVMFDIAMVLIVVYVSPMAQQVEDHGGVWPMVSTSLWPHWNTVFVGLGVLSFAFVCQHSAFIIAGSLQQPTRHRWKQVTRSALSFCALLAILCGTCGYLGYLDTTQGNVLNNLQSNPILSNIARALLGTTMLFVYPMESFVARHVCVVLLFQGRRAHEGEDSAILARRDRRLALTVSLYLMALIPAMVFENLGKVLAATGAVGGSCISYIGVGAVYLGVYGADFVRLADPWHRDVVALLASLENSWKTCCCCCCWNQKTKLPLSSLQKITKSATNTTTTSTTTNILAAVVDEESIPLKVGINGTSTAEPPAAESSSSSSWLVLILKTMGWYVCGMPLWYWLATTGKDNLILFRRAQAGKSPHLSRIDSRVGKPSLLPPTRRRLMDDIQEEDHHHHADRELDELALHSSIRGGVGRIVVRSESGFTPGSGGTILPPKSGVLTASYQQQQVATATAAAAALTPLKSSISSSSTTTTQQQHNPSAAKKKTHAVEKSRLVGEDDQDHDDASPTCTDFLIAIGYMLFGVVALIVGLLSLAYS